MSELSKKALIKKVLSIPNQSNQYLLQIAATWFGLTYLINNYKKIYKILNNTQSLQLIDFGRGNGFRSYHDNLNINSIYELKYNLNDFSFNHKILIKLKLLQSTNVVIVKNTVPLQNELIIKKYAVFFTISSTGKYTIYKNCKLKKGFKIEPGSGFIGINSRDLFPFGILAVCLG